MGWYRLLLAVLVVGFHFGGWSPLTGRTTVFGFYCLSGFLMMLVIDRVYAREPGGTRRFYANRLIRIYAIYGLYLIAMVIAIKIKGGVDFTVDPGQPRFNLVPEAAAHLGPLDYLKEILFGQNSWKAPVEASSPVLIPQGWSLGVEMMFYLVAPLLPLLGRSRLAWSGVAAIFIGYIALTIALDLSLDVYRYKSFMGAGIVFLYGAALYRFRDNLPKLPFPGAFALAGAIAWLEVLQHVKDPATDLSFYLVVALQMATVYAVVQIQLKGRLRRVDRWLGNISYGVFVAQFLAAFILLALADSMRTQSNPYPFGRVNQAEFGHWAILLTIVLATISYIAVEHPLERLRDRVRGSARGALLK